MAPHKKYPALGRGLDALIQTEEVKTEGSSSISEIELSLIHPNPNQPRREFDADSLQELADDCIESLQLFQISKMCTAFKDNKAGIRNSFFHFFSHPERCFRIGIAPDEQCACVEFFVKVR